MRLLRLVYVPGLGFNFPPFSCIYGTNNDFITLFRNFVLLWRNVDNVSLTEKEVHCPHQYSFPKETARKLACKFTVKPLNTNVADRPRVFRIQWYFILNPFKFGGLIFCMLPPFFNYNFSKTPLVAGALVVPGWHAASGVAMTLFELRKKSWWLAPERGDYVGPNCCSSPCPLLPITRRLHELHFVMLGHCCAQWLVAWDLECSISTFGAENIVMDFPVSTFCVTLSSRASTGRPHLQAWDLRMFCSKWHLNCSRFPLLQTRFPRSWCWWT